jgi:hypothetical protein
MQISAGASSTIFRNDLSNVEDMGISIAAIVHAAHQVIVEKSYGGKCDSDPSAITSLTMRLHKTIRETMMHVRRTTKDTELDWETKVFVPVVANFNPVEDLKISNADTDYIILLATIIVLAYEILLLPGASRNNKFLAKTFNDYLCEPEIYCQLNKSLKVEQQRLNRADADSQTQQAVHLMRSFLSHALAGTFEWKTEPSNQHHQIDVSELHRSIQRSQSVRKGFTLTPRDLIVQVFLKSGCSYNFDFVHRIVHSGRKVVVKTCVGLRMHVEEGITVSRIWGTFDTVTIEAGEAREGTLAATIVVPPGYAYRAIEVENVSRAEGKSAPTIVETKQATLSISHGGYVVNHGGCRQSVIIESTEC